MPADPNTYQCSYREWAARRPWPLKKAMIRLESDTWRWVEGQRTPAEFKQRLSTKVSETAIFRKQLCGKPAAQGAAG
jgi:hypothetical protein